MDSTDMFEAALILASKKCGQEEVDYYMNLPIIPHTFSKRHTRRIKNVFRKEKYRNILSGVRIFTQRAVVALLVLCTVLFGTVMSIEAVREDIWTVVTTFFEEYFRFGNNAPEEQIEIKNYKSPEWIPEGYTEIERTQTLQTFDIVYISENGDFLNYSQSLYNYTSAEHDNEDAVFSTVEINGLQGKYIEYTDDKNTNLLIWYDDEYVYELTASLSKSNLIQIAENLK